MMFTHSAIIKPSYSLFLVLFHVLVFMSFILNLVMVLVCVLLPLPSCRFAIGSLVHCVMFSLVCSCHVTYSVCYK